MTDELIDIFNEDGEVAGKAKRSEVHAKGHIHKTVVFFLLDKEGRVFVNQRTENKEFYPEYWSIAFGGHVPAGETHDTAVVREGKEEADVDGIPIFITSFKKRYDKEDKENIKVYAFVVENKPKLYPDEIKHGKFMTMEELEQKMKKEKFLPETKELYQILKDYKKLE